MGKKRNKDIQSGRIPDEDMPHVGDIWKVTVPYGDDYVSYHYLLVKAAADDFFADLTFDVLQLESGETTRMFFNFELDDWQFIA